MPPAPSHHEITITLGEAGRSMTVERFEPERAGPAASVVLLHGADGLSYRGPAYRAMARHLAARGLRVFLPHYFERVGTPGRAAFSKPTDFLGWMDGATETLTAAGPGPTGIVGVSLGGYLGLAVTGRDERVGAVVVVSGGMLSMLSAGFTRMPPVLILHGAEDQVVPVSEARVLEKWLVEHGTPHEVVIYPGERHHLTGTAADDSLHRTTAFLQRHLQTV